MGDSFTRLVRVLYLGIEARCCGVWVLYAQGGEKMQVAVQGIELIPARGSIFMPEPQRARSAYAH